MRWKERILSSREGVELKYGVTPSLVLLLPEVMSELLVEEGVDYLDVMGIGFEIDGMRVGISDGLTESFRFYVNVEIVEKEGI